MTSSHIQSFPKSQETHTPRVLTFVIIFTASLSKRRVLVRLESSLCVSFFNIDTRIDQRIKLVQGQIEKSQSVAYLHDHEIVWR